MYHCWKCGRSVPRKGKRHRNKCPNCGKTVRQGAPRRYIDHAHMQV